ncbi:MAG: DUF3159 domain-containing protein [Actinomycetia bacterium]|nr:DUF3159 domain-containing protein [Actinomycetes bacterium]
MTEPTAPAPDADGADDNVAPIAPAGSTIAGVDIAAAIGGRRGLLDRGLPSLVFVGVYTLGGQELQPALIAALVVAALLTMWRLIRRQPLTQALAGFAGVAIASFIASRTGEARNYFVTGLLTNGAYLLACLVSIAFRWPLVGVVLGPLLGEGMTWRKHPERFAVYRRMTWVFAGLFAIRLVVQGYLYWQDDVLWLGIARFAMGLPLYLSAAALAYWMIRKAPPAHPVPREDVGGESNGADEG